MSDATTSKSEKETEPEDVAAEAGDERSRRRSEELREDDEADLAPEEETEEDDDVPQEGDILEPGGHLIELATNVPCRQEVLLAGLQRIGFRNVLFDQSRARSSAHFPVREHRCVGELMLPVQIHQTDKMRWTYVRRMSLDTARDVNRDFRLKLVSFELETGTLYEAIFISRDRTQPTRQIVEQHLNEMGFIPVKLAALHRDKRLEARSAASVSVWFGLLQWDAPPSYVTEDDPFYFEELVAV